MLLTSDGERYLVLWMWLCEGKLRVKTSHFRLPSASQKRACLSSRVVPTTSLFIAKFLVLVFDLSFFFLRHVKIHRKPQARRNPLGKIYYIYIFCALVFTDPVQYAVSEIRSFIDRTKSIFLDSKFNFTLYRIHDFRVKFFVVFIFKGS